MRSGLASEHTTSKHSCSRALSRNAREILSRAHEVSMLKKKYLNEAGRSKETKSMAAGERERKSESESGA